MNKLSNKRKELILKVLVVCGCVSGGVFAVGSLVTMFLFSQKVFEIFTAISFGVFAFIGILFMVLLPVFGNSFNQKSIQAEKFQLYFDSYNLMVNYLNCSLANESYSAQAIIPLGTDGEVKEYVKQTGMRTIGCFTMVHSPELSDRILETANNCVTEILQNSYGENTIISSVNMISVFCVSKITPFFKRLINSGSQQELKNGRLLVGISFGDKKIYISKPSPDFMIIKYKRLRKQFIRIMNIKK